ncbi:MAG TPA: HD domain-containing protein [Candidatus Woesebacteria bacterium]|nr:HD domain-containing protein [Candidatus Woesebacteria bacterium]
MTKLEIPDKVKKIITKFNQSGAEIYIVGGACRDLLLGREVTDWDFTTNLTPEEMKKLFPKNSFYNNDFGTFSVVGKKGEIFEITTFRTDVGYSDGRHPDEVRWGKSLAEDLARRDFSINAIAITGISAEKMEIIDLFEGRKDLENKLIRTMGNPDERFKEDGLRLMRAVRIASQLGFEIEEKTLVSIQKNAKLINQISSERVRDELFKLLLSPIPSKGVELLRQSGLLGEIMPELLEGLNMAQKGHHIDDVWTHNLKTLDNCQSKNPITRLAALLHDVGKPRSMSGEGETRTFHNHEVYGSRMAVRLGKNFKLSNKELDQLFRLVRWHMFTVQETQTDKAVRRFIRNVTPEYIDEMIDLRRADRLGSGSKETSWRWELFKKRIIEVQKQPFSVRDLKIDGKDVMEILQISPGPKVGEVLNGIFEQVEENPSINDRETLLEKIRQYKN